MRDSVHPLPVARLARLIPAVSKSNLCANGKSLTPTSHPLANWLSSPVAHTIKKRDKGG